VIIDTTGHLGTVVSSERFKENVQPMDKASEVILALKPVTFRYKEELDPEGIPQFGLVAEEVEKVSSDLVTRDDQGKPYTVRYEAVNAMLLNEFLKEHRKVEQLQKQVEALTAGLQKVSAQLELNKRAPETVSNNQ
jgi:trimeric autotransporter adhesin